MFISGNVCVFVFVCYDDIFEEVAVVEMYYRQCGMNGKSNEEGMRSLKGFCFYILELP